MFQPVNNVPTFFGFLAFCRFFDTIMEKLITILWIYVAKMKAIILTSYDLVLLDEEMYEGLGMN